MHKKVIGLITLLCLALPLVVFAANNWQMKTQVLSAGGSITMQPSGDVNTYGLKFATYTTSGSTSYSATITPNAGYKIASVIYDGAPQFPANSSLAFTIAAFLPQAGEQHMVSVNFAKVLNTVTMNTAPGGYVVPSGSLKYSPGATVTYTLTPAAGNAVQSVSGAPVRVPGFPTTPITSGTAYYNASTGAEIQLPAATDVQVLMTVKGIQAAATITPNFKGIVASAGQSQVAQLVGGTVTISLAGSATPSTGASYSWQLISFPTNGGGNSIQTPTAASAKYVATQPGVYTFKLTVNGSGASDSATVTATVNASLVEGSRVECESCHSQVGVGAGIFHSWSGSIHAQSGHAACEACHYGTNAGGHPGTVNFATVDTKTFLVKVANVNAGGTANAGLIAAPGPGVVFCEYCHVPGAAQYPAPAHVALPLLNGVTCAGCHTDPLGQNTGIGDAHSIQSLPGCVSCHSVQQKQVNANTVNDNNGVRQIAGAGGEFKQWSHHIINDTNVNGSTADPLDAQCVVCHSEGTISSKGVVSVNTPAHMANDGIIHLRDCNTGLAQSQSSNGEFAWNPEAPNHTAMDQFCMSCHNAAGAVSAPRPAGTPKTATALNPFGDLIQNNYDGLARNAVVAVYDQFDPNNTSHHAVRAPRYTANSADTTAAQGNNMFPAGATKVVAASGTFANISANNAAAGFTNLRYANGTSYVGTIADTGKFITTYKALDGFNGTGTNSLKPITDNTQLHCGDCHTVGQWAARGTAAFGAYSTAYGPGVSTFYKQAIGAHGSGNEYMLRNSNGNNTLNPLSLVCYNCHASTLYGSGGSSTATRVKLLISGVLPTGPQNGGGIDSNVSWTMYNYTSATRSQNVGINFGGNNYGATLYNDPQALANGAVATTATAHDGIAGTLNDVHCNDDQNDTAGLTGLARLNSKNLTAAAFAGYTTGRFGNAGGANAFGIKCANCHNSGDGTNPGYGGIHGNAFRPATPLADGSDVVRNAPYTTYSSTTGAKVVAGGTVVQTSHKPYRFLPGLGNFRYNGGSDWSLAINRSANFASVGCYTLQGSTTTDPIVSYPKNGNHQANFTGSAKAVTGAANDNGLLGTWGACTEHTAGIGGASAPSNEGSPSRNVLRPTSY